MAIQKNYYLILDLDPSTDNWADIEARIREKKRVWSMDRTTGTPKKRREGTAFMELLPKMQQELEHPETRRQIAAEARAILKKQGQEQEKRLQDSIATFKTTGKCSQSQLVRLVEMYKHDFTPNEIERRVRTAGIQIEGKGSRKGSGAKKLEYLADSLRKAIWEQKSAAGTSSLYELLNLPQRSPCAALTEAANKLNAENVLKKATDAVTLAKTSLTGHALAVFKDAISKEKYDNSLAVAALETLRNTIELAADDGILQPAQIKYFLEQGGKLGVKTELTRAWIEEFAANRNIKMIADIQVVTAEVIQCGLCGSLGADNNQEFCTNCSEPLQTSCPGCGNRQPTAVAACGRCGFRLDELGLMTHFLRNGEAFEKQGQLNKAHSSYQSGLKLWPDWKPLAEAAQRVTGRLEKHRKQLQDLQMQADQTACYVTAARQLAAAKDLHDLGGYQQLHNHIQSRIVKSRRETQDAARHIKAGQEAEGMRLLASALAVCADLPEALDLAKTLVIPAPRTFKATARVQAVDIFWEDSGGGLSGYGYTLIRQKGAVPAAQGDGQELFAGPTTAYTDTDVVCGVPYYYAVFACWSGRTSRLVTTGPCMTVAGVENLNARASNKMVTLSWTPPPNCRFVEVWRTIGNQKPSRNQGTSMATVGNGLRDTQVTNGQQYRYAVYAGFSSPDGKNTIIYGPPQEVAAIPVAPPPQVKGLKVQLVGNEALVACPVPSNARLEIRMGLQEPVHAPGSVISTAEADALGQRISLQNPSGTRVSLKHSGIIYFIPLAIISETATVGTFQHLVHLQPVTNLTARSANDAIRLNWAWPANATIARVALSPRGYPVDDRDLAHTVKRIGSETTGSFDYYPEKKTACYFSVFTALPDTSQLSAPAHVAAGISGAGRVHYRIEVQREGLFRKKIIQVSLVITSDMHIHLPPAVLVGKRRSLPIEATDGSILLRLPKAEIVNGRCDIEIPKQHQGRHLHVKLFFESSEDAENIRLIPAEKAKMVIP